MKLGMIGDRHMREVTRKGFCGGIAARRALQRARFAQSVRLFNNVDEQGIKYLLKHLPAWIKVSH